MAKTLRFRRMTTPQAAAYTGPTGELIVDTGSYSIRVQDGTTVGGNRLATAAETLGAFAAIADLNALDAALDAHIAAYTIYTDANDVDIAALDADVIALTGSIASVSASAVNASNLSAGTLPDARFPATLPAVSGANLTALNASALTTGTVPDARLAVAVGAVSALTPAADKIAYYNSTTTAALADFTTFGRTLIANANAADTRTDLGLGALAVLATVGTTQIDNEAVTLTKIAQQADLTVLANISGGAAVPAARTVTAILDAALGATQGAVLFRGATEWDILAPGTAGYVLATGGAGANPAWAEAVTDLGSLNANNLTSGTVPDARFPAALPAISGAALTSLNANSLGSGTIPNARFPATLPAASAANLTSIPAANITGTLAAISGANLTNLNATNLSTGTVAAARLATALSALNGLTPAADALPYYTSASASAVTTLTAAARTLLDDASVSAMRTTLELGTMALEAAANYLAKSGNLSGLADNAVARTNLGLGTAAIVNTGTSGAAIPLLNGANTHSGANTFSAGIDISTPLTTPTTTEAGYMGTPHNTQNGAYGFVLADRGKTVDHTSATPHTYTIPANASVAFPIGTVICIDNGDGAGAITLAITSDTLRWGSQTGSRTIAANSQAAIKKKTATLWVLVGNGIT